MVRRAPSVSGPNLDMPARLTLQRYRNEASAAKYEMNAVLKEMKRHKKESDRVQLQQQLSIRSLKDQLALAQQTLQELVGCLCHVTPHAKASLLLLLLSMKLCGMCSYVYMLPCKYLRSLVVCAPMRTQAACLCPLHTSIILALPLRATFTVTDDCA